MTVRECQERPPWPGGTPAGAALGCRRRAPAPGAFVLALVVAALSGWAFPVPGSAQGADLASGLALEVVATGLVAPVALSHAGDHRLFVVLRDGRIVILDGDQVLPEPFLDLRPLVLSGGERGLLGLAFHPGFAGNRFFFVNYTNAGGNTVIARYRVSAGDPNRADPHSAAILMTIAQPFGNHNGGQLKFGPDGYLYIGTGDGGAANDPICAGQRSDTLLGKVLRIDVDQNTGQPPFYGIPPDNPFAGSGGPLPEIWATGLRNPWRFSFDRASGDLFIADVGQSAREEINLQPAGSQGGENYGWKRMEGTVCRAEVSGCPPQVPACGSPELTLPILEYATGADCAVIGGYVYRGAGIPQLEGAYLFGDHCSGRLWAGVPGGGGPGSPMTTWSRVELGLALPGLTSFGETEAGEIVLASLGGSLFRLTGDPEPGPGPPVPEPGVLELSAATFTAAAADGAATITVRRVEGADGAVSVAFRTEGGTAAPGFDYLPVTGALEWGDGDQSVKSFTVPLVHDFLPDPQRTVGLVLSDPGGGATLGLASGELSLAAEAPAGGPCEESDRVLCLAAGRFRIEVGWRVPDGSAGFGRTLPLTHDSGAFWFFDPANLELMVKVLDACATPFERIWVFAAGLTDVAVKLLVVDTETLTLRRYLNPAGVPFAPVQDTAAFAVCP